MECSAPELLQPGKLGAPVFHIGLPAERAGAAAAQGRQRGWFDFSGLELGWLPEPTPERAAVGFSGRKEKDLNKAVFARPLVPVGLPWRLTFIGAATPPLPMLGITPALFAFGLERTLIVCQRWWLGWRGSGQVGAVRGAFTCPAKARGFPAGSPNNPSGCMGESKARATLRNHTKARKSSLRMPRPASTWRTPRFKWMRPWRRYTIATGSGCAV